MKLNWLNWLIDWNPQLLREIKGRLKPRNAAIAAAISLIGQLLLFLALQTQLPTPLLNNSDAQSQYCTGSLEDGILRDCIQGSLGNLIIDWRLWWLDLFMLLGTIVIIVLLVTGTFLLISDLANEERRGTLNFIRLSPRSLESIFIGKLLGVPILLYLIVVLALPLHLGAGLAAQFSLIQILSFYGVFIASCFFFYSAALLFSLVTTWLGGIQAWLGSGSVLILLLLSYSKQIEGSPTDLLNLFSPSSLLQQLAVSTKLKLVSNFIDIRPLQWFSLPVGFNTLGIASFQFLNYGVWTYWSWQALKRRLLRPNQPILSKQQSYLLVACFTVVAMGFALPQRLYWYKNWDGTFLSFDLISVPIFNLILFFSSILVLTPKRQALQDWARYRKQKISRCQSLWSSSLVRDLIWGEKSPALVAIAINVAISYAILVPWLMFGLQQDEKLVVFLSWLISFNLTLIYAAIAQLIMLVRIQKQEIWAIGTLSALILLPLVLLTLLSSYFYPSRILGLFTPWAGEFIWYVGLIRVFPVLLGQWGILALLTWQITRQIGRMGESESKTLLAAAGRERN